jgi:hypothetical protein
MTPQEELQKLINEKNFERYPNFPKAYLPPPKKSKSDSMQLQNDIQKFCKLNGQFCEPVHTKGTYRADIGKYTAGNYIKGSADLHILLWAEHSLIVWMCEVKYDKDRQSEDQKKYELSINEFGSKRPLHKGGKVLYSIVKTFDDFHEQYNKLICL